ncbi:hypothetical protein F2P81_006504 [Scophthalmus maximus]|uniref:Uncharacterized protein n=1 Tax=Scophthalmus maximus TaxID=52904 RepID=A0A6A4SZA3_SCOMX|nr:hypothetical protein F2P81_006504 [Scophthalmus maximus]
MSSKVEKKWLSHAQRSAVKVLRRMQYFVARKKFQAGRHSGEARNVSSRRTSAGTLVLWFNDTNRNSIDVRNDSDASSTLNSLNCCCDRGRMTSGVSPGKGEDKEYPTIGARLIRLEDKTFTLLSTPPSPIQR